MAATLRDAGTIALLTVPGALTLYLSFESGGFFPAATSVAALAFASALTCRVLLSVDPFAGLSRSPSVVLAALSAFAVWTVASSLWSNSPGRSVIELNRTLMYLLSFAVFASLPREVRTLRWVLRSVLAGMVVVCVAAFVSRALPDVFSTTPGFANDRLSYPISYWNGLGILAGIATLLAFAMTTSDREPATVRILAAVAMPVTAATALLTFSRAGLGAAALGLLVYLAIAGQRRLVTGLLATFPTCAVALVYAYDAELLATTKPTTDAAIEQGHELALVVALAGLAAGLIRVALIPLERVLERVDPAPRARRAFALLPVGVIVLTAVALAIFTQAPSKASDQWQAFVSDDPGRTTLVRERLLQGGNGGRLDHWEVSLASFRDNPLGGSGAGTYELAWAKERPKPSEVLDAHSLYVETLGELGIVGLVLLLVVLGVIIFGVARGVRGRDRATYAAALAALVAWALHAGYDWDWELTAVSLWVFPVAALALPPGRSIITRRPTPVSRGLITAGVLVVSVLPILVVISQNRLDDATEAFVDGDCVAARQAAKASRAALPIRAEPVLLLGYCQSEAGEHAPARATMSDARRLDPNNWKVHYASALVNAAARRDPRDEAAQALRLNPLNPLAREAVGRFATTSPTRWRAAAFELQVPVS